MTLECLLSSVGEQFQDWTGGLLDESLSTLEARYDRLSRNLARHYPLLISQRAVVTGLRHRKKVSEQRTIELAERVEVFANLGDRDRAWKTALELDQERELLERESEQLEAHELAYRQQRDDIEVLKQRLAELRERIERKRRWLA
jgi:hypothetical protein